MPARLKPPGEGPTWCGLTAEPLPIDAAYRWALGPDCGAVVLFSGTARDHSEGREQVTRLEYEAYEEHVVPHLEQVVGEARARFPTLGRVVVLHRTGPLELTDSAVVVVATAPHRTEAFDAARHLIDRVKETAPIWKREHHAAGADWARA